MSVSDDLRATADLVQRGWCQGAPATDEHGSFYEAITFMEPSRPGHELALARDQAELDLSRRQVSPPAGG